jgi:predicted RNase H-like HicB family nuclease
MKRHPEYLVVIEKENNSFGAYVPDLPGCVAVAKTRARVRKLIEEAIALHLEDMRATGQTIPRPSASFELITAA